MKNRLPATHGLRNAALVAGEFPCPAWRSLPMMTPRKDRGEAKLSGKSLG